MEGVLGLIYLAGFVCSTFGLRMLRVAGKGSGTALLFGVQIIGFSLADYQNFVMSITIILLRPLIHSVCLDDRQPTRLLLPSKNR